MSGCLPLAPALDALGSSKDRGRLAKLAMIVDVHPRTLLKWQAEGVDVWTADRIASRLGVNATKLWPAWEDLADAAAGDVEQLDIFDMEVSTG